jgi:hypothetical protein
MIAHVAGQILSEVGSGAIRSVNFPLAVTAGYFAMIAGVIWDSADFVKADVSVTKGGGSATLGAISLLFGASALPWGGGFGHPFIAYAPVVTGGSLTLTVTMAHSVFMAFVSDEFSGVASSPPLEVDGGENSGSGSPISDTLATLTSGALLIGVAITGVDTNFTVGAGFTEIYEITQSSVHPLHIEFKIAGSPTTYTVDWTHNAGATAWRMICAAFKDASASAAAVRQASAHYAMRRSS